MEEIKNAEAVKTEAPKPGTKDALKAENDALKAELKAKMAVMEALKAKEAKRAMKTETNEDAEAPKETGPKMVKIRIPKTKEQKEDVFVAVNFRTYQIQRGVEVEVPDFVAEVLQHKEEMLEEIMLFEEKAQKGK